MSRVLVVHPRLVPHGGGNGLAAWALQALRGRFQVSVVTFDAATPAVLNRTWGTSLQPGDYRVHVPARPLARFRRFWPWNGALLEASLLMRFAQDLDRRKPYDILLSTHNEMDLGRRGICYVHEPWAYASNAVRSERGPLVGALSDPYRRVCRAVGRATDSGLGGNLLLANSAFTADRIRALHGVASTVLFPPVAGGFPCVPWAERESAVVAVGRLHGCKRWDVAVEIVEEVRRRGHPLGFTLVAHPEDLEYGRGLERLAATRPWFRILTDLTREELRATLSRHRYGLHTMINEPFGMAPAEIVSASCLLFSHRSGGPMEILRGEPRLMFDDVGEAAGWIEAVLDNEALDMELRRGLESQRDRFGAEVFCAGLATTLERFVGEVK